jgi:chitinase
MVRPGERAVPLGCSKGPGIIGQRFSSQALEAHNPIGSIVQGHTNLTEIKTALQLFWRAEITPAQLALGFGFYGHSFTLADPSCTKPGCPFSGAAKAGPCSGTGCMLAHYEI